MLNVHDTQEYGVIIHTYHGSIMVEADCLLSCMFNAVAGLNRRRDRKKNITYIGINGFKKL